MGNARAVAVRWRGAIARSCACPRQQLSQQFLSMESLPMKGLFSDEMRRNPYPLYEQMRNASPVHYVPPPFDAWMIFDYQGVKRALNDHDTFSSRVPAPRHWFIFFDPPSHTKRRALISLS